MIENGYRYRVLMCLVLVQAGASAQNISHPVVNNISPIISATRFVSCLRSAWKQINLCTNVGTGTGPCSCREMLLVQCEGKEGQVATEAALLQTEEMSFLFYGEALAAASSLLTSKYLRSFLATTVAGSTCASVGR
jgi:hypothetical protein